MTSTCLGMKYGSTTWKLEDGKSFIWGKITVNHSFGEKSDKSLNWCGKGTEQGENSLISLFSPIKLLQKWVKYFRSGFVFFPVRASKMFFQREVGEAAGASSLDGSVCPPVWGVLGFLG